MRAVTPMTLICFSLLWISCAGCNPGITPTDGGCDAATADLDTGAADDSARARGKALVFALGCRGCHDPGDGSLSGALSPVPKQASGVTSWGRNLTSDSETGLGDWSDEQIARAIRTGIDDQGMELCPTMPRFGELDDAQAAAIVDFLRGLLPVTHDVPPSTCPPIKGSLPEIPDAAAPPDLADLSHPSDLAISDAPSLPDGGPADADPDCGVRINEVQTAGAGGASDEFIELYNTCDTALDLDGNELVYRSAAGITDLHFLHFGHSMIPAHGFLVCGQSAFTGKADLVYKSQMSSDGGGLAIRDGNGAVIDSMGYGTAMNAFVMQMPAAAPPAGRSVERLPDGHRSGRSAHDFQIGALPTPGQPNH